MAQSFVQYVSNGQIYSVPFTYVNKSHVSVLVDGQPVEFTWNSNSVVRLAYAPAQGKVVEIRRTTPSAERLVDFVDGSTLTENDLDMASTQFLYLSQEATDRAASNPTLTPQGTFDFAGRRSVGAADPVDPQDLVTKRWVLTQAAIEGPVGPAGPAGPVGAPGATGPVGPVGPAGTVDTSALNAKVDKSAVGTSGGVASYDDPCFGAGQKTVLDYGAKGDGVTDDTAAFNAMAAAEGGRILIPRSAAGYVLNGRVGSLTDNAKLQVLGAGAAITKILLGANGGFDVSGRGWRVEGIGVVANGVVECALRCGTGTDNTGSSIKACTFIADGTSTRYFKIACDLLNWWYGVIDGCYFQNNLIADPNAGTALRCSYSVNDSVINSSFYGWDTAYVWTAPPNPAPNSGNTCEGHTISNNIFVVNRRHVVFDDGLLPLLINNVLDLTKPNGNALVCNATDAIVMGNWFAFLSNSPLGNPSANQALVTFSKDSHVVQGNVWGSSTSGIALNITNCGYSIFSANQFRGYSQGMTANGGCTNITVFGNKFLNQAAGSANANLSLVSDLTWFANDRLGGSGFVLPGSYNGANGPVEAAQPASYAFTTVVTTPTTAAVQTIDVALPAGKFSSKPVVFPMLANQAGETLIVHADFDNSTTTSARINLRRADSQTLAQGLAFRLNIFARATG